MKLAVIIAVFLWLACGVGGAWRLGEPRPLSLEGDRHGADHPGEGALDDNPVSYPGP